MKNETQAFQMYKEMKNEYIKKYTSASSMEALYVIMMREAENIIDNLIGDKNL